MVGKFVFRPVELAPPNGPGAEPWGGAGWRVRATAGPAGVAARVIQEPADDSAAALFRAPHLWFFASRGDIVASGRELPAAIRRDISAQPYDQGHRIRPDHG